jgi:hypothetical protein
MEKGVIETLNEYMVKVFDKNKDGVVTFKELMAVFPSYAVGMAILFVDLLVLVAEYRVWDFGYTVTGDGLKAIGFVLVSAVPFYLGQVFWLYPRATMIQKGIALAFISMSLYTSYQFGAADLTKKYDVNSIFNFMLELFVGYVVFTLIYIVVDPTIKKNRAVINAKDNAKFEEELQVAARLVLASLKKTMETQAGIAKDFGNDETITALNLVRGKQPEKAKQQPPQPVRQFAETVDAANPTPAGSQNQPPRENGQH